MLTSTTTTACRRCLAQVTALRSFSTSSYSKSTLLKGKHVEVRERDWRWGGEEARMRAITSTPGKSRRMLSSSAAIHATPTTASDRTSKDKPRSRRRVSLPFFTSTTASTSTTPSAAENLPLPSTSPLIPALSPLPTPLPSTLLSNGLPNPAIRWRGRGTTQTSISEDVEAYKSLSKLRLSMFVVLTTMAGYTICPIDPSTVLIGGESMEILANSLLPDGTTLSSLAPTSPTSPPTTTSTANALSLTTLLPLVVGTSLSAFSSAAFNEVLEAPYDAQMARTRNRPVPKRTLSPLHATTFGVLTGTVGLGTLYAINPLCSLISLCTIILYCPIYTIMKRHTIYNTWLGAIVGSLPPLIGWSACTGSLDPFSGNAGGWAMFLLLYFWQFPHFNALSHNIKSSYAASGYRMLSVLDPAKNALVSFRYALAILPLSFTFPLLGLTNAYFPLIALAPNGLLAWAAFKFWRERTTKSASWCFWASLVQLPLTLALAMLMKKGRWDGWYLGGEVEGVHVEEDLETGRENSAVVAA